MNLRLVAASCAALLALSACASGESDDTASASSGDAEAKTSAKKQDASDRVGSCDQVAGVVGPYIEALVLTEGSTVDEWGVSCTWEPAEDETDLANNRSVSVGIVDNEEGATAPDTTLLAKQKGFSDVTDAWVEQEGGTAYSLTLEIAVAAATVTTVWLPDHEVTVTGGTWADHPSLDGPAAVEVARRLVG